jgi:hypothetical protein
MPGMSIVQLRADLRDILGLDDIDLPIAKTDLLLNRSWWQIQNILKLPANELDDTFSTVASQREYIIPYPTEAIVSLAYENPDSGDLTPLSLISAGANDAEYSTDPEQETVPEKYFVFGYTISLFPTPDDVYTIHRRRRSLITDFSDASTPQIDSSLYEIILDGAAERGFKNLRDWDAADRMLASWNTKLRMFVPNEVKQDHDSKFAQVKLFRSNTYTVN